MDIVIMKKLLTFLLIYLLPNSSLWTADTCSRVAVVNYQEVLVDTNATQKGDGLRYYLEKDLEAKSYLELYQEGNRTRLSNTVIGTLATSMMFSSFFVDKSSPGREALLIGGFSVMVLNFLMAKTLEHKNEGNLERAIEEYNKRNLPLIDYSSDNRFKRDSEMAEDGIYLNVTKEF